MYIYTYVSEYVLQLGRHGGQMSIVSEKEGDMYRYTPSDAECQPPPSCDQVEEASSPLKAES